MSVDMGITSDGCLRIKRHRAFQRYEVASWSSVLLVHHTFFMDTVSKSNIMLDDKFMRTDEDRDGSGCLFGGYW